MTRSWQPAASGKLLAYNYSIATATVAIERAITGPSVNHGLSGVSSRHAPRARRHGLSLPSVPRHTTSTTNGRLVPRHRTLLAVGAISTPGFLRLKEVDQNLLTTTFPGIAFVTRSGHGVYRFGEASGVRRRRSDLAKTAAAYGVSITNTRHTRNTMAAPLSLPTVWQWSCKSRARRPVSHISAHVPLRIPINGVGSIELGCQCNRRYTAGSNVAG